MKISKAEKGVYSSNVPKYQDNPLLWPFSVKLPTNLPDFCKFGRPILSIIVVKWAGLLHDLIQIEIFKRKRSSFVACDRISRKSMILLFMGNFSINLP